MKVSRNFVLFCALGVLVGCSSSRRKTDGDAQTNTNVDADIHNDGTTGDGGGGSDAGVDPDSGINPNATLTERLGSSTVTIPEGV